MRITTDTLRAACACKKELNIFVAEWPDGAEVTLANCLRAVALGLSFDWAADKLFPVASREEYYRQCAPFLQEEYYRCAPFLEECDRQCAPFPVASLEECDRQCAPFWEEYYRQCAPFWEEYDRQCATVFFAIANEL